jgi:MFS family permease
MNYELRPSLFTTSYRHWPAPSTAASIEQIALWRVLTGLGSSGVVPLGLALVGRLFPYEQRGRPLGWLFGAKAGAWPSAHPWVRSSFHS